MKENNRKGDIQRMPIQLILAIVGIIAILIVANIARGFIAHKTGYSKNRSEMGAAISETSRQAFRAGDLRKEIYKKRDAFRNTDIVNNAIEKIFGDSTHLPAKITMQADGIYVIPFDEQNQRYSTTWVQKLGEGDLPSFDYLNGCAFFLLIQERYPNQYDFPNTKVNDYDSGEVEAIHLNLKSAGNIATW